MCNLQVLLARQTITATENSRFKYIHRCPKHSVFRLASCPSASNQTLTWCANWKMFCLLPVQLCLSLAEPAHVFPEGILHVAVQPSSVSSQPLQASAGVPWVVVEISTEILSPKYWGIRREGSLSPKAGSVTDKQNNLARWVEELPNHWENRDGTWWCGDCLGVEVVGTGAVGLFALIRGGRDLQEGSLSHKKLLLLRTL